MIRLSQREGALAAFAIGSVAWGVAAEATAQATADDAKKRAYGQHLSRECTTCHRIDGVDNGIPSITGWPVADFVTTIRFYKDKLRPNPTMQSVAQSLEDEDMEALSVYFGSLPQPPHKR